MKTTVHYTGEQLNALLDGQMSGDEEVWMRNHMSVCRDCRRAFESHSRVNAALKGLPLLKTRPGFTRKVMDRIPLNGSAPLVLRLLEKLPYLLGLIFVLGVMGVSFYVTGVFDSSQMDQKRGAATGIVDKAGETLAGSISAFSSWLVHYLPFAFGNGSFGVAFFAVGVVAMLAVIDRMFAKKVLQK